MTEPVAPEPAAPTRRERRLAHSAQRSGWRRARRWIVGAVVVVLVAVGGAAAALLGSDSGSGPSDAVAAPPRAGTSRPGAASSTAPVSATTTTWPSQHVPGGPPTDTRHLTVRTTIGGDISPKSVAASGTGFVFAQNMMYRHTVTVYDAAGKLLETIPDTVNLSQFGVAGGATVQGAPVEAAFTRDAHDAYVSNYSMYGPGTVRRAATSARPNRHERRATRRATCTGSRRGRWPSTR